MPPPPPPDGAYGRAVKSACFSLKNCYKRFDALSQQKCLNNDCPLRRDWSQHQEMKSPDNGKGKGPITWITENKNTKNSSDSQMKHKKHKKTHEKTTYSDAWNDSYYWSLAFGNKHGFLSQITHQSCFIEITEEQHDSILLFATQWTNIRLKGSVFQRKHKLTSLAIYCVWCWWTNKLCSNSLCRVLGTYLSRWWLQPISKNLVKLDHFSGGWNNKCLKPPPSFPSEFFESFQPPLAISERHQPGTLHFPLGGAAMYTKKYWYNLDLPPTGSHDQDYILHF